MASQSHKSFFSKLRKKGRSPLLVLICSISILSCQKNPLNEQTIITGKVSAATPEAAKAGAQIMEQGGNAIDAAVAISFVLGVTEPAMSGLGGGTQVLIALPNQTPVAINGATFSPSKTPTGIHKTDLTYHKRSTIPSTVKVLEYIWQKYGSGKISWEDLLTPAIQYAEEGFQVGPFRHKVYKKYERSLSRSKNNTHFFLLPDGQIPGVGDTLKQPVLAKTLRQLAKAGANDFYQGNIAEKIASDMEQNKGWVQLQDLHQFPSPKELPPLHIKFRDYDIYSQPPPCGGWTVLLALNLLEQYPKEELQFNTQSRFEKILTALHLSHQDRKINPITDLNSYEEAASIKLNKQYAKDLLAKMQDDVLLPSENAGGETTHFSVVDKEGICVAVTASINAYFGSVSAAPDLGFLYNTYINDFVFDDPDHPFAIGPGLMNYSSMSPTIVQKDGESVMVIGSPGSARIISSVAQLIQLWVDTDLSLEEIVAAPRLHSINQKIYVEDMRTPIAWLNQFRSQGFRVAYPSYDLVSGNLNPYFGGIHAIAFKNRQWKAVADPRRDGYAHN